MWVQGIFNLHVFYCHLGIQSLTRSLTVNAFIHHYHLLRASEACRFTTYTRKRAGYMKEQKPCHDNWNGWRDGRWDAMVGVGLYFFIRLARQVRRLVSWLLFLMANWWGYALVCVCRMILGFLGVRWVPGIMVYIIVTGICYTNVSSIPC